MGTLLKSLWVLACWGCALGLLALTPARAAEQPLAVTVATTATPTVELRYTLPADGFVSLAIDNADGVRVRNLCGAEPQKAGPNVVAWDGLDDNGNPVPAGSYHWRMLRHTGVGIDYQMSYANPGTPPWSTKDGTGGWGADHTNPQVVMQAGNVMVLGSPMAESGSFLIGINADGIKQWGLRNRFAFGDTLINLASDGTYLYVASEQNPQSLMHYYKKLAHGVLYRYNLADRRLAPMGGADEVVLTDTLEGNVHGLALVGDVAYVSLAKENKIVAVSIAKGTVLADQEIPVPAPCALAAEPAGTLLAVSGTGVVRITPATKQVTPVLTGLEAPQGMCIDKAGNIYVADRGSAQQVKVFSAQGKPLRTTGVKGGRPLIGKLNTNGMLNPTGITIDPTGKLWVAEDDDKPKRFSVWNSQTGAFLTQYIGPPHYGAAQGSVASFDKTMAFAEGVQYTLDWTKKSYEPFSTVNRVADDDNVFGNAGVRRTFRVNGRIITASDTHVQVIGELRDGVMRPLAAVGEIDELTRRIGMHVGPVARKIEELKAAGAKLGGNGFPVAAFIWTDANGDGKAQDSEFVWKPGLKWGGYWGEKIADDLTVYLPSGASTYRLPVTGWNAVGAPIYTFESATTINSGTTEYVAPSPDGKLVVIRGPMTGIDIATGKVVWTYPNRWPNLHASHTADVSAPGRLIGTLMVTGFAQVGGEVGTLFGMNGNLGEQYIMTTDGIFVATAMRDWRFAHGEDTYTVPDEDFGGYFWRDDASGDVYMEAGKSEYRLFKVTGLDTIRRQEGTLTLSQPVVDAATKTAAARTAPRQQVPHATVAKLTAPMPVTGKLADLPKEMTFTEVKADAENTFRFALGYDATNLYLAYDVTDSSPLVNAGRTGRLMFKTGDCVDLMLGLNPNAPDKRAAGVSGDERLLFTVRDGKPLAVLFKQVDPTRNWPVAFMSPSRAIYFGGVDEITDGFTMAVTRSATGYVLTAAIPLATIGLKPKDGLLLSGDAGVIYGSETGDSARLRLYWSNKATAITSDVPSEAVLMPDQWGKLQF